jgi:hypothetical protein
VLATGPAKALGPTQTKQMLLTGFLSAKLFLKFPQAEGLLLHRLAHFTQVFKLIITIFSGARGHNHLIFI